MAKKTEERQQSTRSLRERAEGALGKGEADPSQLSQVELERVLHELRVHQVELEMQNEELRRSQLELEQQRDRYADLYDRSPVGYLTIDARGFVIEINLVAVYMLGEKRREKILGTGMARLVPPEDQEKLYRHHRAVLGGNMLERCEVRLRRRDGHFLDVQLDSLGTKNPGTEAPVCRTAITDISARRKAEQEVAASVREKEVLLREIHHRVKNNLQVISSLVSLQADTVKEPSVRGLFGDVRDRVRAMALVHELLYQSDRLSAINLADYARNLVGYLLRVHGEAAGRPRVNLELAPVTIPIEPAVHCALIVNELVNNAFRHAFPERKNGMIDVTLRLGDDGKDLCLIVKDNGVGLPAGFDFRNTKSLGLRLVGMLGDQLHGTVEAHSDEGTAFRVTFPLNGDTLRS
jgi:PAS domain S-box-containing protein